MSLEFIDFAHYYESSGLTETEQREDFEVYTCFMECLIHYFWSGESIPNDLGINIGSDTLTLVSTLESDNSLQTTFTRAAHNDTAETATP